MADVFPDKLSWCQNEQVCQRVCTGVGVPSALSGPMDWILRDEHYFQLPYTMESDKHSTKETHVIALGKLSQHRTEQHPVSTDGIQTTAERNSLTN